MNETHSDAFVFFGATGDLAFKKIFPSLQAMARRGHLGWYSPQPSIGSFAPPRFTCDLKLVRRSALHDRQPARIDKASMPASN
jgi:glucose-6-phosphate 1-dehydrogenase